MPVDVLGVGENSVDLVYRLPASLAPGEKRRATTHRLSCGGQVATTLCTCAALGLRTAYLGTFGDDARGTAVREAMAARGVDVSHAPVRPVPNRHAVILVDEQSGERTIVWHRDAQLALQPAEILPALVAGARLLHVDATDGRASLAATRLAVEAGIPVTCDVDGAGPEAMDLVAAATVPILAAGVAEALTGQADLERALRALRREHAGWLCATMGALGAVLLEGDRLHRVPPPRVVSVDTTGAGDVFRGAFIHALLRGDDALSVLRTAVAAAAICCTREGAIDSVPSPDEVAAALAR